VIPFRGDTFGYHKSFLTPAIIEYAARDEQKFLVFPASLFMSKNRQMPKLPLKFCR
jgi:hypothetical protein